MENKEKDKIEVDKELAELRQRNTELEKLLSESEQVKRALLETQNTMRALLNAPSDVVLLLDLEGLIVNANATAAQGLGKRLDELIGLCIWDLLPLDIAKGRKAYVDQMILSGAPVRFEDERSGVYFDNVAYPVFGELGKVTQIAVIARDITERKISGKALRESDAKFRAVIDNIQDGILFSDRNMIVSYRSPSYFLINGYTDEERLGYNGLETVFPEDRERVSLLWNQVVDQPDLTVTGQYRILHKNGSVRWMESVAQNLLDHPDLKQIILVTRDITDRKRTEEELDRIINLVPDLICTASTDGYFKKINPAWEKTLGFTADELLLKPFAEFIHPDDLTSTLSEIEKQINGHSTISFVNRYRCKDGTYKWLEWNATPSLDGILLYASARDITDRKRLEAELKESEARWKFALEGSGDGVWDWDVRSNRVYYSPKWKTMLGYEVDEVIDTLNEWEKRVHLDDKEEVYAELERHFQGETPFYQSEHRLLCKDGSYKWILDRGKIIEWTAAGEPKRMVGLHTDISERKQAEEALRKSETKLRVLSKKLIDAQENERKRIANELHDDLGQSLVGLKIQLSRIQNKISTGQEEIKQDIKGVIESINQTTENVRRISRDLRPSVVEHLGLVEALQWLLEDFRSKYRTRVTREIAPVKGILSKNQEIMVFRIFQEALNNIGKHAKATNVIIELREEGGSAFFSIKDNGRGFSLGEVNGKRSDEFGLGLTVMNERAKIAGGNLSIKGAAGKGTEIILSLPLRKRGEKIIAKAKKIK
jgi:PAS domain S-box-containing protein